MNFFWCSYHFKKIPINLPQMEHTTGVVLGGVLETAAIEEQFV